MSLVNRVGVLLVLAALGVGVFGIAPLQSHDQPEGGKKMHCLIGKIIAVEGSGTS